MHIILCRVWTTRGTPAQMCLSTHDVLHYYYIDEPTGVLLTDSAAVAILHSAFITSPLSVPSSPSTTSPIPSQAGVVVCLEDADSIAIVRQLGRVIRSGDRSLPDIEHDPQVALLPAHGTLREDWDDQGLFLGLPQVHIFECRNGPRPRHASVRETKFCLRYPAVYDRVREGHDGRSVGFVTNKATLFNYLSPRAIQAGLGVSVPVTDMADVPGSPPRPSMQPEVVLPLGIRWIP